MAGGRALFVLFGFLTFAEVFCGKESVSTGKLLIDNSLEDEMTNRMPKRYLHHVKHRDAIVTFQRLKSKFIRLAGNTGSYRNDRKHLSISYGNIPTSSKIDLVFVMDKSWNMGVSNFKLVKKFVENLMEYFSIYPAKTRVAIITYSPLVQLEFNFNEHINKACLRKGMREIKFTSATTPIRGALQYIRRNLIFNSAAGARSDAKKVVFVLTHGRETIIPIQAKELKRAGVIIFALGVTNSYRNTEQLFTIATSSFHVFHVRNYAVLNQITQAIQRDLSTKCFNGQTVYDECGSKCTCQNGKLVNCCRLRREFTDLSSTERVRYINTVKTASTNPAYKPQYDSFLTLHKTIFFSGIHEVDFFLPWHRWFVLDYESLLQQVDCRVTVPYWDWSLVGGNPFSSAVWSTGNDGFGGNGVPGGSCVQTGPFRQGIWSLIPSAGGGCLRRNFGSSVPDAIAVQNLISSNSNPSDFLNFEQMLRIQFHDLVHCVINGTMCDFDAASAPEFFLHHGFVDKIWWDWQKQSNAHKFNTYFLTQTALMSSTPYRSRALLDLNNQPRCVCAEYIDPTNSAFARIKAMSSSALRIVPRLPLPKLSSKAAKLFRTSPKELYRVYRLRANIEPNRTVTKNALYGFDAKLGIKLSEFGQGGHAVADEVPKTKSEQDISQV